MIAPVLSSALQSCCLLLIVSNLLPPLLPTQILASRVDLYYILYSFCPHLLGAESLALFPDPYDRLPVFSSLPVPVAGVLLSPSGSQAFITWHRARILSLNLHPHYLLPNPLLHLNSCAESLDSASCSIALLCYVKVHAPLLPSIGPVQQEPSFFLGSCLVTTTRCS